MAIVIPKQNSPHTRQNLLRGASAIIGTTEVHGTHEAEDNCARRFPKPFPCPPTALEEPPPPPPPQDAASWASTFVAPAVTLRASGGGTPALNSHISTVIRSRLG